MSPDLDVATRYMIQKAVLEFITKDYVRNKKHHSRKFSWITVNFKPDVDLHTAIEAVHAFAKRKTIKLIHYSFEQRGETLDAVGHGLHCHMALIPIPTQHGVTNWVRSSFGRFVGTAKAIDIRSYDVGILDEKLAYLRGEKWDADKLRKVEMDAVFRSKYNLEQVYTNGVSQTETSST